MKDFRPIILALETATDLCSVALSVDNRIFTREKLGQRIHSQSLIPMIQGVLQDANVSLNAVTAIAAGKGPGSFTGVRIGASLAQGLAFGLNCPIYPISTLAALAFAATENSRDKNKVFVPLIDARLQEIYWGAYHFNQKGQFCALVQEGLGKPTAILKALPQRHSRHFSGSGWDLYRNEIALQNDDMATVGLYPHAKAVLQLALSLHRHGNKGVSAAEFSPTYIRNKVADKPKAKVFFKEDSLS